MFSVRMFIDKIHTLLIIFIICVYNLIFLI